MYFTHTLGYETAKALRPSRNTYDIHKSYCHGSNQCSKQCLQLPQAIALEKQERKSISGCDHYTSVDWNPR